MPTPTAQSTAHTDGRFKIDDDGDLKIIVRRSSSIGDNQTLDVSPLDVSYSGMKLLAAQPLVFGEIIELRFRSDELDIDFGIDADVRWIRQGEDDEAWLVGCAFATQLANDCVDTLAAGGGVDRRQWPRNVSQIQTSVQLACSSSPFDATLLDYSTTGIRIASAEAIEPNQPIKVVLNDGHGNVFEIRTTSRWMLSFESGYLIGCEVAGKHRSEFEMWRQGLTKVKPQPSPRRRRLGVIGCLLFASLIALFWLLSR